MNRLLGVTRPVVYSLFRVHKFVKMSNDDRDESCIGEGITLYDALLSCHLHWGIDCYRIADQQAVVRIVVSEYKLKKSDKYLAEYEFVADVFTAVLVGGDRQGALPSSTEIFRHKAPIVSKE